MKVPNHIAIILDGNGRWAKERGMPRTYGHVKGCANLENICYDIKDLGVKYLTVYAFSTENWKRSREEVEALMKLFRGYLKKCIKISKKNNMKMKVIGDVTACVPDPDLLIRTSGEQRLSNFLLWQLAYSEFYFTPVAWPDFNKEELIKAIEKYNQRDRRYGGVKEE